VSDNVQSSSALSADIGTKASAGEVSGTDCSRPLRGPLSAYIPNVVVQTHDFRKALFYDDLLLGKLVLINCVSTRDHESWSNIENLAKVQALLGQRLGQDVFIYSIATDPNDDTPEALRSLAEKYGAKDGWLFLTGAQDALQALRDRLFGQSSNHNCSMSLIRYGNVSAGLWGGILATASAESIAERVSWVTAGGPMSGAYAIRRGPARLSDEV